jgi:thioredoxin 1
MGLFDKLFNRPPKPGLPQPTSDETFEQDVLASGLPVVVDFYSNTCPPCHVMSGLLKELGPDYVGRVNIFTVNVNYSPGISQQFGIHSVPTLILFHKGKVVDTVVGLIPLQPLRAKLDELAQRR